MTSVWCQLRLQGPRTYHCADVSKHRVTLGRSTKCDVVIAEPTVSLKHLVIELLNDGRVVVTDFPESTGTYVRQSHSLRFKKLNSNQGHEVSDGDFVAFGSAKDVFFSLDMSTMNEKEKQQKPSGDVRSSRKREFSSYSKKGPDASSDESAKDVPTTSTGEPKRRGRSASSSLASKSDHGKPVSVKVPDDSLFLQEFLTCHVCQSLFYEPVNISPCNHVFCGGCLSPWLKNSRNCPTCRTKIERAGLHHILKNIIHEYLKRHPEAERPLEERVGLDKQDTITKPKPKTRRRQAQQNNASNTPMPDPLLHMVFSLLNSGAGAQTVTFNTLAHFHDDDDEVGDPDPMMMPESESDEDDDDDEHSQGHDNCRVS